MTECRRVVERLTAYVDGTLAGDERVSVERHLAACPPCQAAATDERGGRAVLRHCAPQLRAQLSPPGLRTRCASLAHAHAQSRQSGAPLLAWRTRFVPALLVAILLVFTASAIFSLATRRSDALLAAQLTADHAKCFRVFAPSNAGAADARQLEGMLASRYGWDVHIPPSSPADGVTLIGARRCLYGEGTMPHVMYRVNGQDVSLYMLPGVSREAADIHALGHHARIWSHGATTYVLVTPNNDAGELGTAARYVMREAH
jgi:anti-sigma factor RsiW